jgi:hypothetical protein
MWALATIASSNFSEVNDDMIAAHAGPAGGWPCGRFNKIGGGEAGMPEIDLVDWTIQEAGGCQ